eukprot:TRINITY_DN68369_c0_g1_i1.p1 TRINITY_DN68369_c0_g1~~TRINITY_DN68369_c0_g1_i1.p1  ORF type:complete len:615 (+),score=103.34 TRINITY_DN68369_c0_g1_i1:191-2035(+)
MLQFDGKLMRKSCCTASGKSVCLAGQNGSSCSAKKKDMSLVAHVGNMFYARALLQCRLSLLYLFLVGFLLQEIEAIDGQSLKMADNDLERIFHDTNCERTKNTQEGIDWDEFRNGLLSVPFPQSMVFINPVLQQLQIHEVFNHEMMICPCGIMASLFFFIKYLLEEEKSDLTTVRVFFSVLDGFTSASHPRLLEDADWLVKDSRLISLRRSVLRRLRPEYRFDRREIRRPLIFVYDRETPWVRELSQGASFCSKGQWGMEVHIHEWLLASGHLTEDPEAADFFFVPAYSICMFEGGFFPIPVLDELYRRLVEGLPYFARNQGRDHVFTFGSGMSANVFVSWREVIPEAIFLTPETWLFNDWAKITEPCFDTWKDIVTPGYLQPDEILSLSHFARPLQERDNIAVFLGRTDPSRGPHPSAEGKEPDVRAGLKRLHEQGKIVVAQNLSFHEMHDLMGRTRFCFIPKGKSAWSLRFFEALFANCVPVVLSDNWELPFEAFLDLPSFVIKWPMHDVGDKLLEALHGMPDDIVDRYMDAGRRLRCWYVYPPLLHELHDFGPSGQGFYSRGDNPLRHICPSLDVENAFIGIMQLLEKKRLTAKTSGGYFVPPPDDSSSSE